LRKKSGQPQSFPKSFLFFVKNIPFFGAKNRKKKRLELEKLAAQEEKRQETLLKEVERKKEAVAEKAEIIHRQLETEKQAIEAQLDREMQAIQRSTKTSFKKLAPVHNYLRTKSKLYYVWHLNPYSSTLHFGALLFFIGASVYFMQSIYPVMMNRALAAAKTCHWTGSTDTSWDTESNWDCGSGGVPGEEDYLYFDQAATNNLEMTTPKTVAKIYAPSAGSFNKTFDTVGYDLTVNGDFEWGKGTISRSAGYSMVRVTGNVTVGASSTLTAISFELIGSGNINFDSAKTVDFLVVNKTNASDVVTVSQDFSINYGLHIYSGILNSNDINIIANSDSFRPIGYYIGSNANGGTTSVKLSSDGSQIIVGQGGIALNTITIDKSGGSVKWEGNASVTNLILTTGSLTIEAGKITFPASSDGSGGKLSCAAGQTLSLAGAGAGRIVTLRSDTPSSQWYFENNCGVSTASWVDIKDSNNTSGTITASNSIDSSGNSGWTLNPIANIKIWNGSTSDWSSAGNWTGGVPTSTDIAIFNSGSQDCSITSATQVIGIISTDGYSGTLSATNDVTTTGTDSGLSWGGGTFNINSSTLSFGSGSYTNSFSQIGGTMLLSSGNITKTSGGNQHFYIYLLNSEINNISSYHDITLFGEITVNGTYNQIDDRLVSGIVNLYGDLQSTSDDVTYTSGGRIKWYQSGDRTWSPAGQIPHISFMSNRTITLGADLYSSGFYGPGFEIKAGTIDVSETNYTIYSSNLYLNGGSINARSGTVVLIGGTNWIPGETQYYNVTIPSSAGLNPSIYGSAYVGNTFNLDFGLAGSGRINLYGDLNIGTNINQKRGGNIYWYKDSDETFSPQGPVPHMYFMSERTVTLGSDIPAPIDAYAGYITVSAGTLDVSANNYKITTPSFAINNTGSFNARQGTLEIGPFGTTSLNAGSSDLYNLIINWSFSSTVVASNTPNITGSLVLKDGKLNGAVKVGKEVIVESTFDGGSASITFNGAGEQLYTLSSVASGGIMPTGDITVNKTTGKVIITSDANTNTLFVSNVVLTSGILEFSGGSSGGNIFTVTAGKAITSSSSANIVRFAGSSGNVVTLDKDAGAGTCSGQNKWCISGTAPKFYANYVNVSNSYNNTGSTIYAMSSTDGGGNTGWDFSETSYSWDGGASTNDWNTAANWNPDGTPDANDIVTIDYAGSAVTTSGAILFGSLTVGGSNASGLTISQAITSGGDLTISSLGTVTQATAWDTQLVLLGDLTINGSDADHPALLTHSDNSTAESYRVNMTIAGDTTVDTYGQVNVDGLGYDVRQGPGKPTNNGAGSYGGRGGAYRIALGDVAGATYGSAIAPDNLGSGGNISSGGGAIQLTVAGTTDISGVISAKGQSHIDGGCGSGGSIYLTTATLVGAGSIQADGGSRIDRNNYSGGGGGRIATVLTGGTSFGSVSMTAYGGTSSSQPDIPYGGAGTIFKKTIMQSYGDIKVDNHDNPSRISGGTLIPISANCQGHAGCENWQFDIITVDNGGDLQIPNETTLTIHSNSVLASGSGTTEGFISWRGGTLVLPSDGNFTVVKATLNADTQIPFDPITSINWINLNNLTIGDGNIAGNLSHSDNSTSETYKMNLNIPGNLTVNTNGGTINVDGLGYDVRQGPGKPTNNGAGSYGGRGGAYRIALGDVAGATYGSAIAPDNLGSGGNISSGGGAIQLTVAGTTDISGVISAKGQSHIDGGCGSGGSIYLTTATLVGAGSIQADGGSRIDRNNYSGGGGGRIATVLTGGTSFGSVSMTAYGGTSSSQPDIPYGGAGTIFKKSADDSGAVEIKNNDLLSTAYATLCGEGDNYNSGCAASINLQSISLSQKGRLSLENNQTVNVAGDVSVASGSEIIFSPDNDGDPLAGAWPTLNVSGDLNNSGSIISNGQGYPAQNGYTNAKGGVGTTYGGGAGFGGNGGAGAGGDGTGGQSYGSATDTNYIGSGGGLSTGGAGGGHIHLNIDGTLNNNTATSLIQANGNAGSTNGGGGSGGGILIETTNLTCNTAGATISANGGNGASEGGGGGAGGRIMAVVTGTRTVDNCTATSTGGTGGSGASNGEAGSVNIQASPTQPTQTLPADEATNQSQETEFTFSTTDPDSDWLRYKLELADDSGFTTNLKTFTQGSTVETQTQTSGGVTGTFSGQNSQSGTAYSSGSTVTFTIDAGTPLIESQTYYWRVSAIDPEGVDSYDGNPHYSTPSSTRSFTVAPIDQLSYTSGTGQTIRAAGSSSDTCSAVFDFEILNSIDETVKLRADDPHTYTLSDGDSGGQFFTTSDCSGSALSPAQLTIAEGSSSAEFYYKNTSPSLTPYTITVAESPQQDPDWSDAQTTIQVNPGILDHFVLSDYQTTVTTEQTFSATVTAYDAQDNVKFDYYGTEANIWFSSSADNYAYPTVLPATSSSKYQFLSGDHGSKTFTNAFQIKKTGSNTIVLHHDAYDGKSQDQLTLTSSTITVNPGATHRFELTDYPRAVNPSYPYYAVSGFEWSEAEGASSDFDMDVTVRDQFNNIKSDYDGSIYFTLYTAQGEEAADYDFYWDSANRLAFDPETDHGQKQANGIAGDYSYFISDTAGKTLDLRISDGTVTTQGAYTIYIKPLELDHFAITTNQTLSRQGTVNDQDNDEEWDHDDTPVSVTVTAYDTRGNVKVDYGYNETTGEGRIYFYSPERSVQSGGELVNNMEFPYYKTSASDISASFEFPIESAGVHTFTAEDEIFKFFKGGRRTIYVAESITPSDSYALEKNLKDPNFSDALWDDRTENVKTGVLPVGSTIAVETHVPGSTHTNDDHSDDSNNNITIGPGDEKLVLSWQNPFDLPASAEPKIYFYQSTNGTDYSLLSSPRPNAVGASQWQSEEVTGLTNDQQYWYRLCLGYKRSDGTYILSDYSNVVTETPKAIAPVNVVASQLDKDGEDGQRFGQVKITYSLRFESTTTFSYFNPVTLTWNDITDSAISGDKGVLSGNFDEPILHTTYFEMNTDFDGYYLNGSFKIRVNVSVDGQGSSNSESNLFTLDTKNPHDTSLVIDATANTSADLSISASDDSAPIRMMVSNEADFNGAEWQEYATSIESYNIEGVSTIYIKFMDDYYNETEISTPVGEMPASFAVKDASNIEDAEYRLVLIWRTIEGIDHYNIWRSNDGESYTKVDTTTKNGYLDINLSNELTYYYKVTSEDANGNISLPAGPLSSRPGSAPDVTADPLVELFGWRQEYGVRAKITWNTDQEADSFIVYSKEELEEGISTKTKSGADALIAGDVSMTLNHEVMLYHLDPSTKYYFKSLSKNEIQITGASAVLSFTTPERIPLLIQGMTISDTTINSAQVTWSTTKLSTTIMQYSTTAILGDTVSADAITINDTDMNTTHSFKLDNLTSGAKYYLRVRSTDSDSNTTISDIYTFSTFAMPIISNVNVKETSYNTATIEWQTNVNADSNVEYSTNQNSELKTQNEGEGTSNSQATPATGQQGKSDSTTIHSVTLIGLSPKTTYSYRVISSDQFGNTATGQTLSFTTATDTISPQISNVKSEVASTGSGETVKYQAIISWDTDEPATSQIEYAQGIGGDYTDKSLEVESLNSAHVVILPDLKPNSAYHFRIVSKDLVGNIAYSDDISLITPPKEKSLLQVIIKSLEDTFSWVGRLREKWFGE